MFLYSSSDSREETPLATFAFNSFNQSGTKTNRIDALSVGDAIEKAKTQSVFDTVVIKENVSTYHLFIKIADATAPAKLKVVENSGSIRKGSVSFQEYDLTNQFVDGMSEYAYLEGSGITDPVIQGTLPASIPDNAKFLCLVIAQLDAAHAEYQTVGKNNKGLVGGYFQAFDEVVGKWTSNLAARTAGLERCKEICTLINSLNKEVLKSKITLVDKGVFTVDNTNDTIKELSIDVYTPIKFNIQMENLSSLHNSGLLLSITSNCELYNYIPTEVSRDDEFSLLLNGYEYGHRAVRLMSAVVDSINTYSIWIKPNLVYNNATDTIPVTAVHYEISAVIDHFNAVKDRKIENFK